MEQTQPVPAPKAPNPDERVTVISPQGVKGTVSRKNLEPLLQQGFVYVDPEAAAKQALQDKYDAPLTTGALAAANTIFFNAPKVLLDKTGILPVEEQKKLEEANPTASTVGTVGGFVGGSLLKATPLGLLTTAATQVGKQVAAKAGGKALGTAAEYATTGGLISAGVTAGDLTSRAALGEKLTAEQIAQEMSFNTLLGAGASTAFGGLYAGGKKALESQIAKKAVDTTIVKPIRYTTQKALNAYANVFGKITKQSPDDIKELLKDPFTRAGNNARQTLVETAENPTAKIEELAKTVDELFVTGQTISKSLRGEQGLKSIERDELLKATNNVIIKSAGDDAYKAADEAISMMMADPKFSKSDIKKLQIITNEFKLNLDNLAEKNAKAKDYYNALENFRINIDKKIKEGAPVGPNSLQEFRQVARDLRGNIANTLKDESKFGAAGLRTKELDKAWSEFLNAEQAFLKKFGVKNPDATPFNDLPKIIPNPDKFKTYASQIDKINGKNAQILTNNYIMSMANLARQIEKHPKEIITRINRDEKFKAALDNIRSKIATGEQVDKLLQNKRMLDKDLEILKKYTDISQVAQQAGEVALPAVVAGFAADYLDIDPMLAATVVGGYRFLKDPTKVFTALNAAEKAIFKSKDLTQKAARAITTDRKIGPVEIQPKNMLYVSVVGSMADGKETKSSSSIPIPKKVASIQERQEEFSKVLGNPMDAMERVGRNLGPLAAMNEDLAMNMQTQTLKTIQYLNDKIPAGITSEDDPLRPSRMPSETEIAKYERIYEAATNPMIVLKRLEEGRLTKDEVDTIRYLYPEMYQDMVFEITNAIAENPKGLTYSRKIQLSILFGQAFDPSMSPELLKTVQSSYNPNSQPQQSPQPLQPGRINVAQLGKSGVVNNFMTDAQRAFMQ